MKLEDFHQYGDGELVFHGTGYKILIEKFHDSKTCYTISLLHKDVRVKSSLAVNLNDALVEAEIYHKEYNLTKVI